MSCSSHPFTVRRHRGPVTALGLQGLVVPDFVRIPGPEACYGAKTVVDAHNACAGDPYFPFVASTRHGERGDKKRVFDLAKLKIVLFRGVHKIPRPHTCIYIYTYVYLHIYIYLFTYIYICIYIHMINYIHMCAYMVIDDM